MILSEETSAFEAVTFRPDPAPVKGGAITALAASFGTEQTQLNSVQVGLPPVISLEPRWKCWGVDAGIPERTHARARAQAHACRVPWVCGRWGRAAGCPFVGEAVPGGPGAGGRSLCSPGSSCYRWKWHRRGLFPAFSEHSPPSDAAPFQKALSAVSS